MIKPDPCVTPLNSTPDLRHWPQISLWLRGHLSSADRLALLALCGYPVGTIGHSDCDQMRALSEVFGTPALPQQEDSVPEADWTPVPLPLPKP